MRVIELELSGFTSHALTRVAFPERGVVLVRGENGAGKSSLVDAVSFGGWGKTLRGKPPWPKDGTPRTRVALVCTGGLSIVRERRGAKNLLEWSSERVAAREYESPTHAQTALTTEVGAWEVWRRAHVFSSADAAHFSGATDAERKRLVEAVLGLTRFDPALKACRADLKAARTALASAQATFAGAQAKLDGARARREAAAAVLERTRALAPPPLPAAPDEEAGAKAARSLKALRDAVREAQARLSRLDRAEGAEAAQEQAARKRADRLAADACPTCAQPIGAELRATLTADVDAAHARCVEAQAAAVRGRAEVQDELDDLADEMSTLEKISARHASALREYAEAAKAETRHRRGVAASEQELAAAVAEVPLAEQAVAAAEAALTAARREVEILDAVETVLGLDGVRAQMLGRSLRAISAVASTWLPRFGRPDLSVAIRAHREKGDGEMADEIVIDTGGGGGGHGYDAMSAGERRRVDAAILMGLSAVASHGEPGTLWFDEFLDGLDAAGVAAAVDALEELAQDRCVVVITHNDDLASKVRAVQRINVAHGAITVT
jgi:DNA repair exonuclease SbcCD ATPase subunit